MSARFELSTDPLDVAQLRASLQGLEAGAYCGFEGWVRRHNDGREVLGLGYEAYTALALKQGDAIVGEAFERFNVVGVRAVHRVGELSLGEVAVWVGTVAAHRRDAFLACQHVIDRIKEDLPIWKKERYAEAPDRWIGAEPPA
ncbi:MAG: molybdenum cofactor biosynthesis protein MoaE [Opitutales bacterium]